MHPQLAIPQQERRTPGSSKRVDLVREFKVVALSAAKHFQQLFRVKHRAHDLLQLSEDKGKSDKC